MHVWKNRKESKPVAHGASLLWFWRLAPCTTGLFSFLFLLEIGFGLGFRIWDWGFGLGFRIWDWWILTKIMFSTTNWNGFWLGFRIWNHDFGHWFPEFGKINILITKSNGGCLSFINPLQLHYSINSKSIPNWHGQADKHPKNQNTQYPPKPW